MPHLMQSPKIQVLVSAISLLILTYFLGYVIERPQFIALITHYTLYFIIYVGVCHWTKAQKTVLFFIGLGILLRFLLIFSFPNLSDDIYRFIWDGHLLVQGINPFTHLPSYYMEENIVVSGIEEALYQQLNSPNYYTIYPPVSQLIFAIAAFLSPNSWWGCSMVIKFFLFLCEVGSLYYIVQLLKYFRLPLKNILWYALNPLIIIEIMGNVHFEGAMIFFFLLGIWLLLVKEKIVGSALAIALSVASKLLPLIFLPFFVARMTKTSNNTRQLIADKHWLQMLNWKRNILFLGVIGATLLLLFAPLLSGVFIHNFGESLNLYFQKFEFNASIYYVLRWIGFQYRGYNVIQTLGPNLSLIVLVGILAAVFLERQPNWRNLFDRLLFAICFYLLLATTIHPWYVALPIVCCLFTRFRFPILWSGLIFLTYINYSYVVYQENLWLVGLEYFLVAIFVAYELFYYKKYLEDS